MILYLQESFISVPKVHQKHERRKVQGAHQYFMAISPQETCFIERFVQ